jgi:hypothetical protein
MARDQAERNWIGHIRGNDRDSGCRLSHRDRHLGVAGDHNGGLEPDQLVYERRHMPYIAVSISVHDAYVASRNVTEFLHALRKAGHIV